MHFDGSNEDLDDISVCTSGFICLFRTSPSCGLSAFCISRRRSSSDASFVEDEVAIADGDVALVETIFCVDCKFFPVTIFVEAGCTKQ
mmetsp:Transcript_1044/g.1413  ORF Transcript_1044/g.1413 Transcript_1044/m.1413 type:complete len:88 (+) Transcript_1044:544-807(+)